MRSSASLVGLAVEPSAKIAKRCVLLFDRHALPGDCSSLRRNAASPFDANTRSSGVRGVVFAYDLTAADGHRPAG